MNSDRTSRLRALAEELDAMIQNGSAECAVVPGNGLEESMLIGSPDSYLVLAKVLLEIVRDAGEPRSWENNDLEEETLHGVSALGTNRIKAAFRESSPIWLMCAYLAPDDEAARELATRLAAVVRSPG